MRTTIDKELQLLTLEEVAKHLRVSKRTLLRMIQQKKIPAFKVGGQWRIRETQLMQWVKTKENLVLELA